MRNTVKGPKLTLRAIAGSHVVVLGWSMRRSDTAGLLGFAIERSEFQGAKIVEKYFLRGIKRFAEKDTGLASGSPVPTSEHPVQSFQWGDYTPRPGVHYRYRVVPAKGAPKHLQLQDAAALAVDISTEPESGPQHEVYFNRGVAGSQAYARKFSNPHPETSDPQSAQMRWLSRGLYEALVAFIGQASGPGFGLRGALYEFHYEPVGQAVRAALDAGADVRVLYDAPNYRIRNEAMIQALGLIAACQPRGAGGAQKHNKYLVLLKAGEPIAVWTGSTNISAGGIFGHSNVGHVVRDPALAAQFLALWQALEADPTPERLAARNEAASPLPRTLPGRGATTALFSPRAAGTLDWYARLMATARGMVCFTVAFSLAKGFETVLARPSPVLRYVLADKPLNGGAPISRDHNLVVASGAKFDKGELANFLAEHLTGLNSNYYIHTKFMLVDPLGKRPTVVTGSANFSAASQTRNDENMLVIRGDTRVADIYFGEFMRIFDHLYARYLAQQIRAAATLPKAAGSGRAGFLHDNDHWVAAHFGDGPKSLRRQYFAGI
ncbi:phospholipase D-like domain-containing protein [Piscinibacter sp.]|uniref:phospholipase D-like domain-containing protein n=1 Tax=Piscinibacter sp. TaxID=1903157 RepID=UPI002F3E65DB